MGDTTYTEDKPAVYIGMTTKSLIQVGLIGLAVGMVVWGGTYLLDTYVLRVVVCRGVGVGDCASAAYAEGIATVIAAGVGLFALVKLQIFRPLLVVIAAAVSLWGLAGMIVSMPLYGALLGCMLLYMVAYVTFTWIARLRLFWLVAVLLLVVIVTTRLMLTS